MPVIVNDLLLFSCLSVCVPWIVIAIARLLGYASAARIGGKTSGVPSNLAPGFGSPWGDVFATPHGVQTESRTVRSPTRSDLMTPTVVQC